MTPYLINKKGKTVTPVDFPTPNTASYLKELRRVGPWMVEGSMEPQSKQTKAYVPCCIILQLEIAPLGQDRFRTYELITYIPPGDHGRGITYAKKILENFLGQRIHEDQRSYPNVVIATADFSVTDDSYQDMYRQIQKSSSNYRAAGSSEDPIAFADLTDDVRFFKREDFNKGVVMEADVGKIVNRRDPDSL